VNAALKAINHSLGEEGIAKDQIWTLRAQSFCPELAAAPAILDLYRATPAAGAGRGGHRRRSGHRPRQRADRAALSAAARCPPRPPTPHIDGMPGPLNGVTAGTLYHFTALGGVFLSEVDAPSRGTSPCGLERTAPSRRIFRAHGTDELLSGFPKIEMPSPRQLLAGPGDVILAHHQLAHGAAPNVGPHVRYAVFFRLSHRLHDPSSTATMLDIWREWEGLRT
jgi:hypothetical protein